MPWSQIFNVTNMSYREGAQWLNGRVLDSRPKGRGFETYRRHCIVSLSKSPDVTERLLTGI